jgi:carbon-monoxide dehydrogenase medium subunit
MKAPPFHYHRPRSLAEAVSLMASLDNARVIAGGQSLMPMLNFRIVAPDHLIDLGSIPELVEIAEVDGHLRIGAMTTQRSLERAELIDRACPLMAEAVRLIGHQQTRNRGTIGGSLCHLDPGAELPVVAAALDAELTAVGPAGARKIGFADFGAGYLSTTLAADEILTRIAFPIAAPGTGQAFVEFNRRPADFAIVSVAASVRVDEAGRMAQLSIAVGGSFETPQRLRGAEADLKGAKPDEGAFGHAAKAATALACNGDAVYPAEYRQELGAELVRRALRLAVQRARSDAHV